MNQETGANIAASIRQKLLNKARDSARPFNELLQYYAIERFLYRLSVSPHADKFVLKGALMFPVWEAPYSRPTMDIDMLGITSNDTEAMVGIAKHVCAVSVEPDGLIFDAGSITGERIVEDADYEGVRIRLQGGLNRARITLQIDIGFGDVITPEAMEISYPTILPMSAPKLKGYNRETVIAEKFQAMTELGILNSRMKDFYDIWLLSRQFDFNHEILARAINNTFANRNTQILEEPVVFSDKFINDANKQTQWKAFIRKARLENVPDDFAEVVNVIHDFIQPVIKSIN